MAVELLIVGTEGPTLIAGEAITKGNAVCINATDGKAYKASSDASAYSPDRFPAVGFAEETVAASEALGVLVSGLLGGFSGLTVGAAVYLGATAGSVTSTAPTDAGDLVQTLGQAKAAGEVIVEIESDGAVVSV